MLEVPMTIDVNPSQRYETSSAIRNHQWMCSILTLRKQASTRFTYAGV